MVTLSMVIGKPATDGSTWNVSVITSPAFAICPGVPANPRLGLLDSSEICVIIGGAVTICVFH